MIDRFIARPIISVSSVPDAPTSTPLTIRTFSCRTKPVADAASPVQAFSSEITTGMSAPPIGSTNRTPKASEAATTPTSSHSRLEPDEDRDCRATSAAAITSALTSFCPGYTIGRPPISSCSFANATSEPANEIEPMSRRARSSPARG